MCAGKKVSNGCLIQLRCWNICFI